MARARSRYERIYEVVRRIPRGRVASYGEVARRAGLPGAARQVGYALHALSDGSAVPWHRVVNARGEISARASGHEVPQRRILEREGVRFDARGRIDLARFGWSLAALLLAASVVACATPPSAVRSEPVETVVLLHGLASGKLAMKRLAGRLEDAGYRVENVAYSSLLRSPEELVGDLAEIVAACCAESPRVHFVGYSLGGVLARAYLAEHPIANLGRVVLLGAPNHGSQLADWVAHLRLSALLGPTGSQLGTGPASLPNRLPAPTYSVGVVAGRRSLNPLAAWALRGADDGFVSVASARLEGMSDFRVVPRSHVALLFSERVAVEISHFLRHGRFEPEESG